MEGFTINVKVGLEESTIQRLGQIFTTCIGGARPGVPPKPTAAEIRETDPKAVAAPTEAPKAPEIDNMTLNTAVKAAQGRGVEADAIRAVFAKYGIKSSRECPADKRPALLAELNAMQPDLPEAF